MGTPRLNGRLSPRQVERLRALRELARLLDSAFAVPGTSYRVGLDPVLGLVPGLGDLASLMFTAAVLWHARRLGIPRVVQMRMVFNAAIDALVGVVPIVGDLFDAGWKSNERNMALLERHAHETRTAEPGDWLFVLSVTAILVAVAVTPILITAWIIWMVAGLVA